MSYRGQEPIIEKLTVTKSASGATVAVAVSNTNTAASSEATHTVSVGGTSAGDPIYIATVTSGSSWCWGVDNSDSDKFKIGYGVTFGTDTLTIDSSGNVSILGTLTATQFNKITITTPATGATLTLVEGSSLVTSGAYSTTLTATAATNVTLPTTGTLATLAGTEALTNKTVNKVTITAPATSSTLTVADGSSLVTSGAYSTTLTATAATNVTLPTTGTLATLAGSETFTNKSLTTPTLTTPVFSGVPSGTIVSGTYTPTFTAGTNIASNPTATYDAQYFRIGSYVTVYFWANVDPTSANVNSAFVATLPIASDLTVGGDLLGYCVRNPATTAAAEAGTISADTTNNKASINFTPNDAAAKNMIGSFSYKII